MIHRSDVKYVAGLVAGIATALVTQSGVLGLSDLWVHRLMLVGLVSSVTAAYLITPPDSEKRA